MKPVFADEDLTDDVKSVLKESQDFQASEDQSSMDEINGIADHMDGDGEFGGESKTITLDFNAVVELIGQEDADALMAKSTEKGDGVPLTAEDIIACCPGDDTGLGTDATDAPPADVPTDVPPTDDVVGSESAPVVETEAGCDAPKAGCDNPKAAPKAGRDDAAPKTDTKAGDDEGKKHEDAESTEFEAGETEERTEVNKKISDVVSELQKALESLNDITKENDKENKDGKKDKKDKKEKD